jgi:hypothetical protein
MLVSSHRSDNPSSVGGLVGGRGSGNAMLLDDCCGGRGYPVRSCIFKDGLCIGAVVVAPGGTMRVLEFFLVPLSSPIDVPNSFTVSI